MVGRKYQYDAHLCECVSIDKHNPDFMTVRFFDGEEEKVCKDDCILEETDLAFYHQKIRYQHEEILKTIEKALSIKNMKNR